MVIEMKKIGLFMAGMAMGLMMYSYKDKSPKMKQFLKKINIE